MELPEAPAPPPLCVACRGALRPGAAFCAGCGHRVGEPAPPPRVAATSGWPDIRYALVFYFVLLGTQGAIAIAAAIGADTRTVSIFGDSLFAVAALVGAARIRSDLPALYGRAGFGPLGYALIALASLPMFVAVAAFVNLLQSTFHVSSEGYRDLYALGTGWAFLLLCITPPLFEELAFRGTIFGLLRRHLSLREAFVISSFAFAILHLSIPSLITHVPLGLYFCWLRCRGQSLWPGMFAHFLHNSWVLVQDQYGVLPGL